MQITKTEYDELAGKASALSTQVATLTKERDDAKKSYENASEERGRLSRDIDRLQMFLSALPDAPPERPEGAPSYSAVLPVPERLAIWIAKRMK